MSKKRNKREVQKEKHKLISQFQHAVENTEEVAFGYKPGLQAIESQNRAYIEVNSKLLDGSVNIDEEVKGVYPESPRWDYAIGFNGKVYFVEVHPASTSSIIGMLAKAEWLEWWLENKAPLLKRMRNDNLLYWIPSGSCKILQSSPQAKRLAKSRLRIVNPLKL